ncbi:limbic system-associated membrane protein isoform X1 [Drosophila pseudoobscura]|uniref:Limbic system-associated membrane protein isoform X1 n=2 Tax=Drosophila pseudoobscura pseudoobscura TaxID=46245 RepID=A0A6I8UZS8_DROPS|nr:limbic system-associated membrane protein isoform X1 [Drosophila pseudoobscura]
MRIISKLYPRGPLDRNGKMLILLLLIVTLTEAIGAFAPEFVESISNVSVAVGRDATFTCHVRHLGGYRVGWLKADTKAIQAIHENVITHNPRVTVSHLDQNTWNLHIKAVAEEDRGGYMCQLNTDPMKSQIGFLDVVIPPDFISEDTSSDVIVPEGSSVRLTCRARGYPEPIVTWRREDGNEIVLKDNVGTKTLAPSFRGEVLKLSKISRNEMGSYLCIASNGVPPSVSKRISLSIHFHPVIQVPNQLVGAPLGTDVQIECHVEASPKSINYWIKDTGEMIVTSGKYHVQESSQSMYETKMSMIVRKFQKDDVGSYRCIAKNSLGEVDSSIRLYEIPGPNRNKNPLNGKGNGGGGGGGGGGLDADANDILKQKQQVKVTYQPDDEELQYGSAEDFDGDGEGLTPLSPHVYYTSGNKPPTHKPGNSGGGGGNQHQHQHQQHHHHHHHQQQQNGGGAGVGGVGGAPGGGGDPGITRKPPPYYGGNTEVRGPIDNNNGMSSGGAGLRGFGFGIGFPFRIPSQPSLSPISWLTHQEAWHHPHWWHCRQPLLMGLSAVSGLLLTLCLL